MDIIIELSKLGSVGIVSGLFASFIAIRGHRNKKWWEIRVSAYKETIEALSDLYYYFDHNFSAEIGEKHISEEKKSELSEKWSIGYNKIRKSTDVGAFLFSNEAESALRNFIKAMNKGHDSYFDYLDHGMHEVKQCLDALVKCSKKDLKLQFSIFE